MILRDVVTMKRFSSIFFSQGTQKIQLTHLIDSTTKEKSKLENKSIAGVMHSKLI